jgi:hypothetical protein
MFSSNIFPLISDTVNPPFVSLALNIEKASIMYVYNIFGSHFVLVHVLNWVPFCFFSSEIYTY